MVDLVNITNRALQSFGARTTIASLSEKKNEAIQASLVIEQIRDELIRMAPWNCCKNTALLTFITSAPGTEENANSTVLTWQKGIPAPPWAYEYQYPADCVRPLWIIPQFNTGFTSGIPITAAVTGGVPFSALGPPVKFQVAIDQFFAATAAAVNFGGTGYAIGDIITLATPSSGLGAPAQLIVGNVAAGVITEVTLISSVGATGRAGSYFTAPTNPVAQGSTTGSGTGATFNLTMETVAQDQRIILTNQQDAILTYLKRVIDPDIMDELFIDAWVKRLAASLVFTLTGDKALANFKVAEANDAIMKARIGDGNEGLTVNDSTPDWLRVRGIVSPNWEASPNGFEWGPLFQPYG